MTPRELIECLETYNEESWGSLEEKCVFVRTNKSFYEVRDTLYSNGAFTIVFNVPIAIHQSAWQFLNDLNMFSYYDCDENSILAFDEKNGRMYRVVDVETDKDGIVINIVPNED